MSLKLNAPGGGSVTLQEPTTASNVTLNLPAETGTVVYSNASGNVGIGTSSPAAPLDIASGSGGSAYTSYRGNGNTTASELYVGQAANNYAYFFNRANGPIEFGTNNIARALIDTSGRWTVPNQPSFFGGKSNGSWTAQCIFNDVIQNVGNCYSTSTGRFTAPVSGTYGYSVNALANNNNSTGQKSFNVRKNDSVFINAYTYVTNGVYYQFNVSGVIYLNAGDYLTVVGESGEFYGGASVHTNMSVFLIS